MIMRNENFPNRDSAEWSLLVGGAAISERILTVSTCEPCCFLHNFLVFDHSPNSKHGKFCCRLVLQFLCNEAKQLTQKEGSLILTGFQ